ncbi:MAG TPA: glutamate racemase [Candidatus Saccharimonadia bacterium]|nr:glutamate racemase [Candidatus Saccharimonadia bacterium]
MKIGVFDSGLGGLLIAHSLMKALPQYDYVYFGDTAHVPYGDRSTEEVYEFTRDAVDYLLGIDCGLVILACNTASADALRRIQQEYLPEHYPNRRVLGVLIPAAEEAVAATPNRHIGVLATTGTVSSGAFNRELHKLDKRILVTSQPAPRLVPLVEQNQIEQADTLLDEYLGPLRGMDTLLLGCTHYPYMKDLIRQKVGSGVSVICQDEIMPAKLAGYLTRHPEVADTLSEGEERSFLVTALSPTSQSMADRLYEEPVRLRLVQLPKQSGI